MKHLLNTLFVTTQGAYVAKESEMLVVRVDGNVKMQLPVHALGGVVCFGQVGCSPAAMGFCAERGVTVTFLTEHGRFLARVEGPVSGNVLLRREQYRRADSEAATLSIVWPIVMGKVANSRAVLLRSRRDRPEAPGSQAVEGAVESLATLLDQLQRSESADECRGLEGMAARTYFEVFDHLVAQQKEDFFFRERSRRPPLDNVNALLSFVYTLLVHDLRGALETVGLDPAVGFLHRDRPGRPSLALDLMEEFRPWFADRLVLSLINLRQVEGRSFKKAESGAVTMTDDARKEVLVAYQKRKQTEMTHPFLGEQVKVGLLPYLQASLLARYLREDLDGYPPFIWK